MEVLIKIAIIVIFFICVINGNAQEKENNEIDINVEDTTYNKKISIYIHPLSIAGSILSTTNTNNKLNTLLYTTIEIPLSSTKSLIIRPSYWNDVNIFLSTRGSIYLFGLDDINRYGSDIGLRFYQNEKQKGFYMQGQIGIFHFAGVDRDWICLFGCSGDYERVDAMWLDFMGYIGTAWDWKVVRIFFDAGAGCNLFDMKYVNFMFDINFGVGIKLGS